jgi:hypothetical protein
MTTAEEDECIHGLSPTTCTLRLNRMKLRAAPRTRPAVLPDDQKTSEIGVDKRRAYLTELATAARPGLAKSGFGRLTIPAAPLGLLWAEIPDGVWYRRFTQNDKVHSKVTDTSISFRMHIDAYPGDRPLNEAALDIVRAAIEEDLLDSLVTGVSVNWRAARGGANQVMELTTRGGVSSGSPETDAAWFVETANAWLITIRRHALGNLRQLVSQASAIEPRP